MKLVLVDRNEGLPSISFLPPSQGWGGPGQTTRASSRHDPLPAATQCKPWQAHTGTAGAGYGITDYHNYASLGLSIPVFQRLQLYVTIRSVFIALHNRMILTCTM